MLREATQYIHLLFFACQTSNKTNAFERSRYIASTCLPLATESRTSWYTSSNCVVIDFPLMKPCCTIVKFVARDDDNNDYKRKRSSTLDNIHSKEIGR